LALRARAVLLGALMVGPPGAAVRALAAGGSAPLQAAPGQFFPVAPVKAADTREGTGGVPTLPLTAGATIILPGDRGGTGASLWRSGPVRADQRDLAAVQPERRLGGHLQSEYMQGVA